MVVLAGFLGGIVTVVQAWLISRIAGLASLHRAGVPEILPLLVFLMSVILLRGRVIWLGKAYAALLATRVQSEFRGRLYAHLDALGPGFFKKHASSPGVRTGDLVNLLTQGIESLDEYFSSYLPQVVATVLVPGIILAAIFPIDCISALVMLITAPLVPLFMILSGDRAEKLTKQQWSLLGTMGAHFLIS